MLLYFILGMICYILVFPILESLSALISTTLEVPKGSLMSKIAKYNLEIQNLDLEEDDSKISIGFAPPNSNENEDED